jgi:tRNA 2-thiocytidine biosynthesis protein TtcA
MTPLERHIRKWMEKAITDFGMIAPGARVEAAISGGRDSLVMFQLLRGPFVRTPDFHVEFVHVDHGFPGSRAEEVRRWVEEQGAELRIVKRDIFTEAGAGGKRPCFICSRRRRKALLETARDLGCESVALGHQRNDVVESFLLNLTYGREISTMLPRQVLFKGLFHIIRPLYYVRGQVIKQFADEQGIPDLETHCPFVDDSRREFVRGMLSNLEQIRPTVVDDIFAAQFRCKADYLPRPPDGENPPESPPRDLCD